MTPEEQFAELFPIAKAAARAVYGGNQDYVDVDDLTQEAMLWLLEHPKRVKHAHLPNGGIYWPRIVSEVCKVLNAYVGKERLEAQGYEPFEHYVQRGAGGTRATGRVRPDVPSSRPARL